MAFLSLFKPLDVNNPEPDDPVLIHFLHSPPKRFSSPGFLERYAV